MPRYFLPLRQVLPASLIPVGLIAPESDGVLDIVGITGYRVQSLPEGVYVAADIGIDPDQDGDPTLVLAVPGFPDLFGLELSSLGRIEVWIQEDFKLRVSLGALAIRLPRALLHAVEADPDGGWQPLAAPEDVVRVTLAAGDPGASATEHPFTLTIDRQGRIDLEYPFEDEAGAYVEGSLSAPAMIGDTGLVIQVDRLGLDLDAERPAIRLHRATLHLPADVEGAPAVELTDASLDANGFSGTVAATWPLEFDDLSRQFVYQDGGTPTDARLFGLSGGLRQVAVTVESNRLTGAELAGGLVVPYFDEAVDIRLDVEPNGAFLVTLLGVDEDGITLTKEDLLALHLKALAVGRREDGVHEVTVSGGIEPLIMAKDGLAWPRLDVVGLSIDTEGRFRIAEAWLDLSKLEPLDLWGFGFDLKRVGFGYEAERDRLWLDLSGGLRLIPQIPLGFDVEGFRLSWPRQIESADALASQLEVQFAGIHLFYGIPGAVEFEGMIRFFRDAQVVGFAGDVALRVPATGLAIEAGLMIGMVLEPTRFPFLYVYLGVELPAGIPLGQSGLALKGALGLFGLNVSPARTPEENWYYDWYKRPPVVGAHPTNKWQPAPDAIALGVGVTITTVDGYVKGVRGLIVLSIPGPILIIEGRGLVFNGLLPAEPPLRALAVFDGQAQTVQFNLEARAEVVEDVLEAWGGLEAFFDFKDLTNWHLYLGQDEPADRRIQANILKLASGGYLFNANAYVMLDMVGARTLRSRLGFMVGLDQTYDEYDPLRVRLSATLGGDGVVTVGPEELSGRVVLEARVRLSTFGFGCRLGARADVLAEAPTPFKVDATLEVTADLPDPLDDFEAEFRFVWTSPSDVDVEPPLVGASATSDLSPGGGALETLAPSAVGGTDLDQLTAGLIDLLPPLAETEARQAAERAPVVPMDARPTLAFAHDMNDVSAGLFARDPRGDLFTHDIGLIRFRPSLVRVDLYRHRVETPWSDDDFAANWELVASTNDLAVGGGAARLWGAWLADAAPDQPTQPGTRRLRFWTANPFVTARSVLGPGYQRMLGFAATPDEPRQGHVETFLESYPDYLRCRGEAVPTCVDFADAPDPGAAGKGKPDAGHPRRFTHEGLVFEATGPVTLRPGRRRRLPFAPRMLAPQGLAALRGALGELERSFTRLGQPLSPVALAEWAGDLPAEAWERLRGARPDLPWGAWGQGRACLEVDGTLHVRFPSPVRRVRLRFCAPPELTAGQARSRLGVERPPRTPREIDEAKRQAAQKGIRPDLTTCRIAVPFTLTVTRDTWTVESVVPFDCLRFNKGARLEEICYVTADEAARAERAAVECARNAETVEHQGDAPPLLDPDSYYRVLVYTTVGVTRLPADSSVPDLPRALLDELYQAVMGELPSAHGFLQERFFRVDGPPTSIEPYVAWTHPMPQALRVFREDDVRIRFRRAGVSRMYGQPPHRLALLVRAADGTVTPSTPKWSQAPAATLFPDEDAWLRHLGDGAPALPPDDVLTGGRNGAALAPGARHELLVTGGVGGSLLFEDRFVAPALGAAWRGPATGWTVTPQSDAQEGEIRRDHGGAPHLVAGDPSWTDVDVSVDVRAPGGGAVGIVFRSAEGPAPGEPTCFRLVLDRPAQEARIELVSPGGVWAAPVRAFESEDAVFVPETWIRLRVAAVGSRIRAWKFGTLLFDVPAFEAAHFPDRPPSGAPGRGRARREPPPSLPAGHAGIYATEPGSRFRRFAVRDAVLLRVPFTTSAHGRFQALQATFPGTASSVPIVPWSAPEAAPLVNAVLTAGGLHAGAALAWERAPVELRYGERDRAGLEAVRLTARADAAALDDAVLALCVGDGDGDDGIGIPLLDPPVGGLSVFALRGRDNGALRGFWLRSPEPLDLERAGLDGHVGRTTLRLQRRASGAAGWSAVDARWIADVAGTQVLFLPGTAGLAATWGAGQYWLTLTYRRNPGDEVTPGHHRFDRPVEPRQGAAGDEVVSLTWTA